MMRLGINLTLNCHLSEGVVVYGRSISSLSSLSMLFDGFIMETCNQLP